MAIEIRLPDIGDFKNVPIIEIHVKAGDKVVAEQPLMTLESDKASLEVPAPSEGVIEEVKVKVGDKVNEGDLLATFASVAGKGEVDAPRPAPASPDRIDYEADVMVLGAGPGGYTAAFRAADLGQKVVLVERFSTLGGVCLNVGCIPSKALLHVAKVIDEAKHASTYGLRFIGPEIDLDGVRAFKDGVVRRLTGGLTALARQRKVTVVTGEGRFTSPHTLAVETEGRPAHRALLQGDHRRGLRAGRARLHSQRPAHLGFDRARWNCVRFRTGCWSSAAASSGSRWRRSTKRSARKSRSSK